jgi:microsomal dipeptidase-like Zn-dependent dipeptidase
LAAAESDTDAKIAYKHPDEARLGDGGSVGAAVYQQFLAETENDDPAIEQNLVAEAEAEAEKAVQQKQEQVDAAVEQDHTQLSSDMEEADPIDDVEDDLALDEASLRAQLGEHVIT